MAIDENRKFLPGVSIISIKIIFAVKSPKIKEMPNESTL